MTNTAAVRDAAATSVERQAEALLAVVEADRAARCDAILSAARLAAAELRLQAHQAAREQMRRQFDEERRLRAERLAAASATLETRRRHATQVRDSALLGAATRAMPAALQQRWEDARAREAWVQRAIAGALAALPHRAWQIVHPADWAEPERRVIERQLSETLEAPVQLRADPALPAGIAIAVEGTRVDATLPGLLADRADIGARLLDALRADEHAPSRAGA